MEYTFTLRYHLASGCSDPDELLERLGMEACTDALVGMGLAGHLALEFLRDATSADAAVRTAMESVQRAIPTARLIEVAPDLVGLSDIAELAGVTRQNLRKLMLAHRATFPVPVHAGSTSLWHASDVLTWLQEHAGYVLAETTLAVARTAERINLAKQRQRLTDGRKRRLASLV